MAVAESSEVESLRESVRQLSSQELGALHGTEAVALRRAHKSLAQHVTALQAEGIRVEANIKSLQEDLLQSSDIAQAVIEIGTVVAAAFANLRSIGSLCGGVWVCGAAFLGLRLIKGVCNKAWASGYTNPTLKRQLISDWSLLQERIEIMTALLDGDPSSSTPHQYNTALRRQRSGERVGDAQTGM
ncbi:hypothetical protein WJX79_003867 [Trebouxia sp. C0005]